MKRWVLALLVMLAASPGLADPRVSGPSTNADQYSYTVTFPPGDTSDSPAIPVSGACRVRAIVNGSDVLELWSVPTVITAATSGTQVGTDFTSSTTAPTKFDAGTLWVKGVATTNSTGNSQLIIDCSSVSLGGGAGVEEYAFADFPTSGDPPLIIGTDCATAACDAGGGSTRVTLYWDGDSYENVDTTGGVTGLTNPLAADIDGDGSYGLLNADIVEADVVVGAAIASQYATVADAFTAACSLPSRTVVIDEDFSITSTITTACDYMTIKGTGDNATLTGSAGITILDIENDWVTVRGVGFTHASANAANIAIRCADDLPSVSGCSDLLLTENTFTGVTQNGIAIDGRAIVSSVIADNFIFNWNKGIYCEGNTASYDCNQIDIRGNRIRSNQAYGVQLIDVTSVINVSGNTIEGDQDVGFFCDDGAAIVTMTGNHFENDNDPTPGSGTSVDILRQDVAGSSNGACAYVLIGNRFGGEAALNYQEVSQGATKTMGFGNYWRAGWDVTAVSPRNEWSPRFWPAALDRDGEYGVCTDIYNSPAAGGGAQTSGSPDGYCDSDGSTLATMSMLTASTNYVTTDCGSEDGFKMIPGEMCQDAGTGRLWYCKAPTLSGPGDDTPDTDGNAFCDEPSELAPVQVTLVQADCSAVTQAGTFCVDSDNDTLYYGDGATATAIAGGGSGDFLADGSVPMTAELFADATGIEFEPGDALTDCSTFSATGGGIFYDDSEGKFKKCQDNSLTDLDTTGGTPAFSTLTGGTNTSAAMVVGTGASIAASGSGTITATAAPVSGLSGAGTGVTTALGVNVGSAGAFVTNGGALGTPSSGTLTNATGLPVSTGVSGLGTGVATFLGTPSSANLASAVTGETGSGALVFATSPTLVTPNIGAATGTSVALTGAATAASFTADPSATPTVGMKDSDMGGTPDTNASIVANCPTGTTAGGNEDCDLAFNTQVAGTLTEAFRIDTTDAGVQTIVFSQGIVADNLGIDFEDSDTNPSCSAGDYKIYADLSETKLKKCTNGSATDLDTTGGTPSFDTITGGTNTTAAMLVGAGATLRPSSTGVVEATEVDAAAGAAPTASGAILYDTTANDLEYGDNGVNRVVVNTNEGQTLTNKTLTSPTISSPTITGSASGNNTLPSSMIVTEVRSMYWGAGGISSDGTNCANPTEQTINSGPKLWAFSCADSASSIFYGSTVMPDGWDGGNVTFELTVWHGTTETITFAGDFSAQCRGDAEVPSSTWGTAVAADVAITTANQIEQQTTTNVTATGTCAAGDMLFWRYVVDDTNFSTNAANSKVLGVKMEYTSNVGD